MLILPLHFPSGRGGVRVHPRDRTRIGGMARATHPFPRVARASAGTGVAAHRLSIPRSPRRAALSGVSILSAATCGAGARFLRPSAPTKPGDSEWRVDLARRRCQRRSAQAQYTLLRICVSRHIQLLAWNRLKTLRSGIRRARLRNVRFRLRPKLERLPEVSRNRQEDRASAVVTLARLEDRSIRCSIP